MSDTQDLDFDKKSLMFKLAKRIDKEHAGLGRMSMDKTTDFLFGLWDLFEQQVRLNWELVKEIEALKAEKEK